MTAVNRSLGYRQYGSCRTWVLRQYHGLACPAIPDAFTSSLPENVDECRAEQRGRPVATLASGLNPAITAPGRDPWPRPADIQLVSWSRTDKVRLMSSSTVEQVLRELHASLTLRKRPEDVARLIQDLYAAQNTELDAATEAALAKAAEHSLRNLWHGYTSMLEDFARPVGAQRQLARAASLFVNVPELPDSAGDDPERIEAVIRRAGESIGRAYGQNDFGMDRLDRTERTARQASARSPSASTTSASVFCAAWRPNWRG